MSTDIDRRMMERALALATLGLGGTSPNPLVGAVVARAGKVLGQGFHRRAGEEHAEVLAIRDAGRAAWGATLYTNLEPCCHTGRTPPCVDEIIRAGIARVVAAMRDPDSRVNGSGFRRLRRRRIRVEEGLLRDKAARLNCAFTKCARRGLPWVTLKGAASLDGRIGTRTGDSKWITSAEARQHARILRREHDAVLVGIRTVMADDPLLTARPRGVRSQGLLRVIMDTWLRLPVRARILGTLSEGPIVVFTGPGASAAKKRALERRGVSILRVGLKGGRPDLKATLGELARRGVSRVLVEGGGEIHASFIEEGLADAVVLYLAPRLIGGKSARPLIGGHGARRMSEVPMLGGLRYYRVGREIVVEGEFSSGAKR